MPTDHIDNLSIEDLEMEEIRIEPWAELSVQDLEEEEIGRRQSADLSIAYLEEAEMRRETLAQVPRNEDYQNYMHFGLLKIIGKVIIFLLVMEFYLITKVKEEDIILLQEK